ncbi:MAG: DUF6325 family protein [Intrasporangium sp.]|uniref:DUF6325 family protein n=1 Tax=Intrasporangium sp. TaxID=1925024 RepID=UPI0026481EE5|nr:DUF6325 family protein [Intrasporangium sp.]MDN5797981.1 DUF6325 family protein [Intrasporangium sp.]
MNDHTTADLLGPVDFLVIEFPDGQLTGEGFESVLELSRNDTIRVLDIEFVRHDEQGDLVILDTAELGGDERLADLAGAGSGLLDDEDLHTLAGLVDASSSAAVLVYENSWTARLAADLEAGGARLAAVGAVDLDDLDTALGD